MAIEGPTGRYIEDPTVANMARVGARFHTGSQDHNLAHAEYARKYENWADASGSRRGSRIEADDSLLVYEDLLRVAGDEVHNSSGLTVDQSRIVHPDIISNY